MILLFSLHDICFYGLWHLYSYKFFFLSVEKHYHCWNLGLWHICFATLWSCFLQNMRRNCSVWAFGPVALISLWFFHIIIKNTLPFHGNKFIGKIENITSESIHTPLLQFWVRSEKTILFKFWKCMIYDIHICLVILWGGSLQNPWMNMPEFAFVPVALMSLSDDEYSYHDKGHIHFMGTSLLEK